jgi:hypothetical protein
MFGCGHYHTRYGYLRKETASMSRLANIQYAQLRKQNVYCNIPVSVAAVTWAKHAHTRKRKYNLNEGLLNKSKLAQCADGADWRVKVLQGSLPHGSGRSSSLDTSPVGLQLSQQNSRYSHACVSCAEAIQKKESCLLVTSVVRF